MRGRPSPAPLLPTPSITPAATCSRVAVNEVIFDLDGAYRCGAFVNGDPWVAPTTRGGQVRVTTMFPPAGAGRHGWMVNPETGPKQAYDSRIGGFDEALAPSLPFLARGGQSIVKAVSTSDECATSAGGHKPCLASAAVLTVVSEPPPKGAAFFRPPYAGKDKPLIPVSRLRPDLLPQLPMVAGAPSLDAVRDRFQQVQLDHMSTYHGRYLHPAASFGGSQYGSRLASDNNDAALRLMLSEPLNAKLPALVNYVQAGVDWSGVFRSVGGMPADGGHGAGRKIVVAFAGVLLDDPEIKKVAGRRATGTFSEVDHVYFSTTAGRPLFGRACPDGMYDNVYAGGSGKRDCRDPGGEIDGGEVPGQVYQLCCTAKPYKSSSLAIRLLPDGRQVWNHDDFHAYVDRWVSFGTWSSPDSRSRATDKHGSNRDKGSYGSVFQDNMWKAYRDRAQ